MDDHSAPTSAAHTTAHATPYTGMHTTPSARRHRAPASGEPTSRQALKIAHQRVSIDVDLANQTVQGETEITVLPLEPSLRQLKLDCRNIQVEAVFVNNKRTSFKHTDFHRNDEYWTRPDASSTAPAGSAPDQLSVFYDVASKSFDVHQHHLYRGKLHPVYGNTNHLADRNVHTDPQAVQQSYHHPYTPLLLTNSEELTVQFPEGLRLRPQSAHAVAQLSPTKSAHGTPFSASTVLRQETVYTPVVVKIRYTVRHPRSGLLFHGGVATAVPRADWCCGTANADVGFSASNWVPCVDNLYEKCTWDVSISVPKTVGDIGESKIIGTRAAEVAMRRQQRADDDDFDDDADADADADVDVDVDAAADAAREIVVAAQELVNCSESAHPTDFSKKVFTYQLYTPVAPQHVGFAVGAFEKLPLVEVSEDAREAEADGSGAARPASVPMLVYYTPGRRDDVINTCAFLLRAMDLYSKEFGSYPFNSYSVALLPHTPFRACGFAGLSVVSADCIYAADKLEPVLECTEHLAAVLAEQWAGINVVPKTHNDYWCVVGIAEFMAAMYTKSAFGLNQFKYRNKLKSDAVCAQDVRRAPLAHQFFRFPINTDADFGFVRLKASLVMVILDRRMTKTDKSFGLSRVIPKLFLQAMSSDLFNGNCLSTYHFKHVCEKVNHSRLDNFFRNWIYSCGTPVFRITQKFNKKRMVIELTVRQVQLQEAHARADAARADVDFVDTAASFLEADDGDHQLPAVFQGPMTIRVHEADGTPYEHIVELKDVVSRLDIPYNTKYRRLKRGKRRAYDYANDDNDDDGRWNKEPAEELKVNCLGDTLQSADDVAAWNLADWSKEDEENQYAEFFEWLRVDADFEWICTVHLHQPDYMFHSQLQQDRDVEAQLESVRFFSSAAKPTSLYSSILARTVMDDRYFYGVRIEAAAGLAKLAKEENSYIGMRHLLKCYHALFCYNFKYNVMAPVSERDFLPLANDFGDVGRYLLLKRIPAALASIRTPDGGTPLELRKIVLNMLKYNDNLNNRFDDCYYVVSVIDAIFDAICNSGGFLKDTAGDADLHHFMAEVDLELNRILKLEQFLPSYKYVITRGILRQRVRAARLGMATVKLEELLAYTAPSMEQDLRLVAFEGLLLLGGLKNADILHYFFTVAKLDASARLRKKLIDVFLGAISTAALHGTPSTLDDPEFDDFYLSGSGSGSGSGAETGTETGMVFIEDSANKANMKSRRDAFARASISGAIQILRRDYAFGKGLQTEIWAALHSNLISITGKRNLFDVCDLLFEPRDSFIVTVNRANEKKIVAKVGKLDVAEKVYEITLRREGRIKIQIPKLGGKRDKKIKIKTEAAPLAKIKLTGTAKPAPALAAPAPAKPPPVIPAAVSSHAAERIVTLKFSSPRAKGVFRQLTAPSQAVPGHVAVVKSSPYFPLRYVKITTRGGAGPRMVISTDPFEQSAAPVAPAAAPALAPAAAPVVTVESAYPSVKVKISSSKLRDLVQRPSEAAVKSEAGSAVPDETAAASVESGTEPPAQKASLTPQLAPQVSVKKEEPHGESLGAEPATQSADHVASASNSATPAPPAAPRPKIKLKIKR